MISQDTTFSSGATLHRSENEREMMVPPARSLPVWVGLLVVPIFFGIVIRDMDRTPDMGTRLFLAAFILIAAVSVARLGDVLTRRTRFSLTKQFISMTSTGLLGTRSYTCDRGAFRFGEYYQPRRNLPYTMVYFGGQRVKVLVGWQASDIAAVIDELQEWQTLPSTPGGQDEVVLVNSRLRISIEGKARSVELPPPRRNILLLLAIPLVPVWAGVFAYNALNEAHRPNQFAMYIVAAGVALVGVWLLYRAIDLLTTTTRISLTPKYAALASRSIFGRKSFTCGRDEFTLGGIRTGRNSPVPGLELIFGTTSYVALRGADMRDIAELSDVLTQWLSQPA